MKVHISSDAPLTGGRFHAKIVRVLHRMFPVILALTFAHSGSVQVSSPEVLASIALDVDEDGRPDTLQIEMTEGRRYDDRQVWCGRGSKYEGRFVATVLKDGKTPVETPLNALFSPEDAILWFWSGPWQIQTADFNHDGAVEFNLGRYAGCNGWEYLVFSIDDSGKVHKVSALIPVSDFSNSTSKLEPSGNGFTAVYYSNADPRVGDWRAEYDWDRAKQKFVFSGEQRID